MSEKYTFIAAEYAEFETAGLAGTAAAPTITKMLGWLGVSRSGFYEWENREASAAELRRDDLKIQIQALFDEFDSTYGYRRIWGELVRAGQVVGVELVRRLMRELGLYPCQPRPYKATTVRGSDSDKPVADLVEREFTADCPGTKLVGDITYIHTWEGWLYLATVIDCFNNEVVGYAMADHMRAELVTNALDMAYRNHDIAEECIFHSDRGTQYTSHDFAVWLTDHDMRQSLGRTGICYDNALAESFNSMLKVERVHRQTYPTRKKAQDDVANYIELFYNRRRISSVFDYRTPLEVRTQYLSAQHAA